MKSLIQKLVEIPGPSGSEHLIREAIREEAAPHADKVRTDAMGNLIVQKGSGSKNGLRIMVSAHMDEIGLMVTHIDDDGFVRFTTIGGVRPHTCIGGRVIFMNGTRGVISSDPLDKPDQLPTIPQLFVDVGAGSRKDCPVKVGDVAGFERPFLDLGNRLVAKSMDNRISCAVVVQALRKIKQTPHEIHFVFSVQEEVGLRGAGPAAFGVDPELGIAVDVTGVGDTAGPKFYRMEVALGRGPAIKVRDSSVISDPRVVDWMVKTAEKAKIPYQMEVLVAGGTDTQAMQLVRAGVPAGCVSIPTRYIHTPSEMVDYQDVQNAVRLLVNLLSGPVRLG